MNSEITVVKVMLAASESPEFESLQYPLFASVKLDGIRCAHLNGRPMSRKMIEIPNLFVQKWAAEHAEALHGLDGELIVGDPFGEGVFQRSSSGVGSIDGEPDFTFYVFECWDQPQMSAHERYQHLQERVKNIPRCHLVTQTVIENAEAMHSFTRQALEQGYEGSIMKKIAGRYKHGRSTLNEGLLMKGKEWADSEAEILEVLQGTTNQNPEMKDALGHAKRSTAKAGKVLRDTLGSLRVRDIYTGVEFRCSPGSMSEVEIKKLWDAREHLPGKIIVYKFQKVGVKDKPRFPAMKGFREKFDI